MRKRLSLGYFIILLVLFMGLILLPLCWHASPPKARQLQPVPYSQQAFLKRLAKELGPIAKAYGVKPSVLLAQADLESQHGQTLLAAKYANLYALPAKPGQAAIALTPSSVAPFLQNSSAAQAMTQGQTVRYARYLSWDQAARDYLQRLKAGELADTDLYTHLATQKGYVKPSQALQKYLYPQDKNRAQAMIQVIEQYNLTQYD